MSRESPKVRPSSWALNNNPGNRGLLVLEAVRGFHGTNGPGECNPQ